MCTISDTGCALIVREMIRKYRRKNLRAEGETISRPFFFFFLSVGAKKRGNEKVAKRT